MSLPFKMPFAPMEALSVEDIPTGPEWQYEPKWDGFRCLAFRDGARVELQSKSGQPLTRYFPELVAALAALKAPAFVLDGEIVVPDGAAFSFDALLQRIHPAQSRVTRLAAETPALFIVFDLLVDAVGKSLVRDNLDTRRKALENFTKRALGHSKIIRLSPATAQLTDAKKWFAQVGNALDGIIAKRRDKPYASGTRDAMQKIKNLRSADCVVGGFRYNEGRKVVGSLLLGLYDDAGLLHHGRVQAFAEGEAVDQQGRRDRTFGRRQRVFLGIAAQRLQALFLLAEHALAVGDVARDLVLALLLDPEQWIEPLRAHRHQDSLG